MPQMYPYFVFRFIPAGAGNTDRRHNGWVAYAVYPRWRGEHKSAIHALTLYPGLSPLARGTRDGALIEKFFCRFIPAGAGNTASLNVNGVYTAVYPRWRGEHLTSKAAPISGGGLSPLARGTHKAGYTSRGTGRFIPAGAGNTPIDSIGGPWITVYPRWRGEHFLNIMEPRRHCGLSPLARGTRRLNNEELSIFRFIPAGAGNTA